jgi:hypothetical protein
LESDRVDLEVLARDCAGRFLGDDFAGVTM